MSLHNKKVKIKVESFIEREELLSKFFLKFINDNKDEVFTAQKEINMEGLYSLKENDIWTFFETDLELVKSKKKK